MLAIDRFGASGKGTEVVEAFGFNAANVVALLKESIAPWKSFLKV
jgi:transketolase